MRALIGHSGFVGGNLLRQRGFDELYNSKNIEEIDGRSFDLVVCAGAPAEKWKANADPEVDRATIERLEYYLRDVGAVRFVLISTIDVYPMPRNVDETTLIHPEMLHPYGRHRLHLEQTIRDLFPHALILRLPGLFGTGLKKNALYDLINDNQVDRIDGRGVFQFYNVDNLWADIDRSIELDLGLLNVSSEPLPISTIAREIFDRELTVSPSAPSVIYDFRSIHARHWGRRDGYLYSGDRVMEEIERFVGESAAGGSGAIGE